MHLCKSVSIFSIKKFRGKFVKKNPTNVYRVLSNYNLISGSSDEGCWEFGKWA